MKLINMDDIMGATFNELGSSIRATFKKTVNTKQYESETVEASTTLELESAVSGIERMIINSALQAQMEYAVCVQMSNKGFISRDELKTRKDMLEGDMNSLIRVAYRLDPNFDVDKVLGPVIKDSNETYDVEFDG